MMIGLKNINRVCLRGTPITPGDDMAKTSITVNLSAGHTRVPTVLTTPPYSVMILDNAGEITNPPMVKAVIAFSDGVYNIDIDSVDELLNVNIYILY